MVNNWISKTINEIKEIPFSEINDYQIVYVDEWGDSAFYHPNYIPMYENNSSFYIDEVSYALMENYCLAPFNKNYSQPGRWLKMGDIVLNLSLNYPDTQVSSPLYTSLEKPQILPYRIGQKCTVISRYFPSGYEDNQDDYFKNFPIEIAVVWESLKAPTPEEVALMNPNESQEIFGLFWWLTYPKPVISYVNPRKLLGDSLKIGGLIWYKADDGRFYINTSNDPSTYNPWNEIVLTEGAI